jgi:protease-4
MKTLSLAIISASIAIAASPNAQAAAAKSKTVVPVYDLQGAIGESGQSSSSLLSLDFSGARPLSFFDLVRSLAAAANDPNVPAVVLDVDAAGLGLAQVQELRRHLEALRAAGKDVHIYTENLGNGIALLGSAANHLTLMPQGNVGLTGLYSESMYFKGMFDKAGVKVDVVHIGDFKSAGETFSRSGPSNPAKLQQAQLLDAIYAEIVGGIAKGRGLKPAQVKALIDDGAISPAHAKDAGLVDELAYRTDFIAALRAKYEGAKFDKGYRLPDLDGPDIDGFFDLMKLVFQNGADKRFKDDYIAVVPMEGAISAESIKPARTELLRAARDEKCKAVVLRVNSPGGSAAASDVLWEATAELKATGKPFVVSMGGVAASGGYYISADADRIFAEAGTITGSIGVVGMKMAIGGALEKLGIETHGQKRGRFADAMSMTKPMNAAQREVIRRSMLEVYGTFKQRILDGRGERIKGDLEKLAGGRVYSGTAALKIGLVDQIGGLADAVSYAAKQAKLKSPPAYLLPEPKGVFDGLFGPPQKADPNGEFIGAAKPESGPVFGMSQQLQASGILQLLDPWKQRELDRALSLLEASRENGVMLIGPATNIRLD